MNTAPFILSAQFSGLSLPASGPNSVTLAQKEFAHDVATLEFWADDVDSDSYYSGMPMQIVYGRPGITRTFWGYVNDAVRPNVKLNPGSLTRANSTLVRCVGASWPMKQTDTVVWQNLTADQVVATIAQIFGFSAFVVPHPTVWPTLPMGGMSYWKFCVSLAQRIGYTFYCNGIQLVFKPRSTDPNNMAGYVRQYDYRANPSQLPVFIPNVGVNSTAGGQNRNRQMAGINPRTQVPIYSYATQNPPSPRVLGSVIESTPFMETLHLSAHSQGEADAKLVGVTQSNQLYMTAKATSVGDPYLTQGGLISVLNANGSQDGFWYITSVLHQFSTQTYESDMALGRDSRGAALSVTFPPTVSLPPQATLVNGSWMMTP